MMTPAKRSAHSGQERALLRVKSSQMKPSSSGSAIGSSIRCGREPSRKKR